MNLLISSTRMWNPGDEVIYLGVKHLLEARFGRFTPVLWNRNPSVKPMRGAYDNSFQGSRHSLEVFDFYVSAGGPEWLGPRVSEIYPCLLESGIRCLHLGIGLGEVNLVWDRAARRIFSESADLVTCRDRTTFEALEGIVPKEKLHLMPCPSLFSFFDVYRPRASSKVKTVGLNFQGAGMRYNNVGKEAFRRCLEAYENVSKEFDVRIICNYVDDFDQAVRLFNPSKVRFSADVWDFAEFFDEVDVVVGTRIHGCMGAIAAGTPGFLLDSEVDLRRRGVREVMEVLDPGPMEGVGLVDLLKSSDPAALSRRNRRYAEEVKARYLTLLEPVASSAKSGLATDPEAARRPFLGERCSSLAERVELLMEKVRRRLG